MSGREILVCEGQLSNKARVGVTFMDYQSFMKPNKQNTGGKILLNKLKNMFAGIRL